MYLHFILGRRVKGKLHSKIMLKYILYCSISHLITRLAWNYYFFWIFQEYPPEFPQVLYIIPIMNCKYHKRDTITILLIPVFHDKDSLTWHAGYLKPKLIFKVYSQTLPAVPKTVGSYPGLHYKGSGTCFYSFALKRQLVSCLLIVLILPWLNCILFHLRMNVADFLHF